MLTLLDEGVLESEGRQKILTLHHSFKHSVSLSCQKSGNLPKHIYVLHHLKLGAKLFLLTHPIIYTTLKTEKTTQVHSTQCLEYNATS